MLTINLKCLALLLFCVCFVANNYAPVAVPGSIFTNNSSSIPSPEESKRYSEWIKAFLSAEAAKKPAAAVAVPAALTPRTVNVLDLPKDLLANSGEAGIIAAPSKSDDVEDLFDTSDEEEAKRQAAEQEEAKGKAKEAAVTTIQALVRGRNSRKALNPPVVTTRPELDAESIFKAATAAAEQVSAKREFIEPVARKLQTAFRERQAAKQALAEKAAAKQLAAVEKKPVVKRKRKAPGEEESNGEEKFSNDQIKRLGLDLPTAKSSGTLPAIGLPVTRPFSARASAGDQAPRSPVSLPAIAPLPAISSRAAVSPTPPSPRSTSSSPGRRG